MGLLALAVGWALPASGAVLELPVEFSVQNTNTSRVPCASDQASYLVRGHLVGPASVLGAADAEAVTLYLHPLDSGEWFWRFKAVPGLDYAAEMAALGHVSLVVDRIGYGSSAHPIGYLSCVGSQADVAHQLIQALRAGLYTVEGASPVAFSRVVIGGLSIGGLLSQVEAYSYQDVDALMVMGWSDSGITQEAQTAFAVAEAICAAGGDPNEPQGLPGYAFFFQDEEDFKAGVFHSASDSVRDAAAAMRNRNPCGDMTTIVEGIQVDRVALSEITVPVLLLYGEEDAAFQGGNGQGALFTGSADVTTVFFEETGHFIPLEESAGELRATVSAWLCDRDLVSAPCGGGDQAGAKATGGGWLETYEGRKINFGFNAKEKPSGPHGKLQLNDKTAGVKIHLSEVTAIGAVEGQCGSISASSDALEFRGVGRFNGAGGSEFRVCVEDNGEPGNSRSSSTPDRFYLECLSGCGYDTASRVPDDALDGGNIQVHQPAGSSGGSSATAQEASVLVLDPVLLTEAEVGAPQVLTVHAYDAAGELLPGAFVSVSWVDSGGSPVGLEGVTGPDGTLPFAVTIPAQVTEYVAWSSDLDSNAVEVTASE